MPVYQHISLAVCRPQAWYWQVIVRFRVLLLTAAPVMVADDGVTGAGLSLAVIVVFTFVLARVQPLAFLRNNFLTLWSNLACTMILFAGVAFAATAPTGVDGQTGGSSDDNLYANPAARQVITAIFLLYVATTFVVLLHGCAMEWLYYINEEVAQRRWMRFLVRSCFFRTMFCTDRSFARDFRSSLTTNGTSCLSVISRLCP